MFRTFDVRTLAVAFAFVALGSSPLLAGEKDVDLRSALTFYASFDEAIRGDFGGGGLAPASRHGKPGEPSKYVFSDGIDAKAFRIAKGKGIHGGALESLDVLPDSGRIYFPAKGNIAYKPGGWGGALSVWINLDPNTMLKTPFCDPIQITQKGANNGGLWFDFPDSKPRDMRLGVFPGVAEGQKPFAESDPNAPLVVVKNVGFKSGEWHHLVATWDNFDTGEPNAVATFYVDGKQVGRLSDRPLGMRWDIDRTGIYFAVNYIGLLDELALFNRPLTADEINHLRAHPGSLSK